MQYGELLSRLFIDLQSILRSTLKLPNTSFQQIFAIFIMEHDGIEMSKFSKILGIDNSTATRLIDGLEKKGWVIRKRSKEDNRILQVFLTSKGNDIYNSIEIQLEKMGSAIENQLDENLRQEISEVVLSLNWALVKAKIK